ncbi:MAG: phosphatase PAP2 family protein [Planctomycetales bacterium]|nr:phosphatase PAP2 family protein [Planctomycetales bacterium]
MVKSIHPFFENLEFRYMMAIWQNPGMYLDVDASQYVSPIDALLVINAINNNGPRSLAGENRPSGEPFCDVNGDDFLSPIDVLLVINGLNRARDPMVLVANVSATSDANRNGIIMGNGLTIVGQTLPDVELSINPSEAPPSGVISAPIKAGSNSQGRFEVTLALSEAVTQTFAINAMDEIGRRTSTQITVQRGDVVQDWNAAVLNVIRDWTTTSNDPYDNRIVTAQPPMVARNLAMIHTAMFDAINAVEGGYESYIYDGPQHPTPSTIAAAAGAAYRVASNLYHDVDELAIWNASLTESLAVVDDGAARDEGLELGYLIGDLILAARSNDGSQATEIYTPQGLPGTWRRTFPDYIPPLLPQWPDVAPFAIPSGDAFRPPAPPDLTSEEYATAVDEVMRLGSLASTERTSDQTEIAVFWADGGGTATPPGHWNRIASDVISEQQLSLIDSARTLALLNLALADAGIAAWDAKYGYDIWRPIDAIRRADTDSNDQTIADPTWLPLLRTPPFPTYTSGHSTFSGAAAAVLTSLFGDNYAFSSTSDGHTGYAQRPLDPSLITTRSFTSFNEAADEAGISRIYGGIHFNFDNTAGLESGRQVGDYVVERLLRRNAG